MLDRYIPVQCSLFLHFQSNSQDTLIDTSLFSNRYHLLSDGSLLYFHYFIPQLFYNQSNHSSG